MKNILKILFLISLTNFLSCRQSNQINPTPDINIQCQRMSSCYATHSDLITNPFIINLVKQAQKSNDPKQCQTAVLEIEKSIKIQCPF